MSISNISSGYSFYQAANNHRQRRQEFDALSEALQSGDLSGAQQAFTQLQQNAPTGSQTSDGDGGIVADISALGQALASSDLSGAQNAFSTLQSDFKNAPPPPPPSDASSSGASDNPFATDLQSLSDALSSGDISSAQSAFAQLQDDLQNAPPPPPPGGTGGPEGSDKVQDAFSDLATALQNGDLDTAQTAFTTLQSLAPDNQTASTSSATTATDSTSGSDQIGNDFASLSEALQNGDLNSAKSLFETLLADLQANAPRHPGMHQYQQDDSATNTVSVTA